MARLDTIAGSHSHVEDCCEEMTGHLGPSLWLDTSDPGCRLLAADSFDRDNRAASSRRASDRDFAGADLVAKRPTHPGEEQAEGSNRDGRGRDRPDGLPPWARRWMNFHDHAYSQVPGPAGRSTRLNVRTATVPAASRLVRWDLHSHRWQPVAVPDPAWVSLPDNDGLEVIRADRDRSGSAISVVPASQVEQFIPQ